MDIVSQSQRPAVKGTGSRVSLSAGGCAAWCAVHRRSRPASSRCRAGPPFAEVCADRTDASWRSPGGTNLEGVASGPAAKRSCRRDVLRCGSVRPGFRALWRSARGAQAAPGLEATRVGVPCFAAAPDSGSWGWMSEHPCWPCSPSPEGRAGQNSQ